MVSPMISKSLEKTTALLVAWAGWPTWTACLAILSLGVLAGHTHAAPIAITPITRAEPVDFQKEIIPIFRKKCLACHSTGAAGAPKVGDAVAWADRIAKGNEVLYLSGVNGVPGTGMIAKGGCVSCSDEEIHAAVDFMVAGSQ